MNILMISGRLTCDPELVRTTNSTVAKFTVAVKRNRKNQNGEYPVDFIFCQVWGKRGETIAKYFVKGSKINLVGSLQISSFEDKKTGEKRHTATCVAPNEDVFDFVDSNKNSPAARGEEVKPANNLPSEMSMDDLGEFEEVVGDNDLPF